MLPTVSPDDPSACVRADASRASGTDASMDRVHRGGCVLVPEQPQSVDHKRRVPEPAQRLPGHQPLDALVGAEPLHDRRRGDAHRFGCARRLGRLAVAFLINLPGGILGLVLAAIFVRESKDPPPRPLPDLLGALLIVLSVSLVVGGLVQSRNWGWDDTRVPLSIAIGISLAVALVVRSMRHTCPIPHRPPPARPRRPRRRPSRPPRPKDLADVADGLVRQQRTLHPADHTRHGTEQRQAELAGAPHRDHPGHGTRHGDLDPQDRATRLRRPHEHRVERNSPRAVLVGR